MPAPMRLLLVEDDEGDAVLVREELADAAMPTEMTWVRTLAEAEAQPADGHACVLLDLGLPDGRGIDALRRLRRHLPDAAVLVLTGQEDEALGIQALSFGAQDYLVKGQVDGQLLARAIRYAVERRRAERSQAALREAELQARENARLERGLLPTPLLADGTPVRVGSGYRPGRRRALLGGDFYDVVERPDGTLRCVMGDVSGHSADEAALGASLRVAWRTLVLAGAPPAELWATLEELLVHERHREDLFVTLADLVVAPGRRSAELLLAGHPPPLLVEEGGRVSLLQVPGRLPLGVWPGRPYEASRVVLPPRWGVLLYTDGLIEGRVGSGSQRLGSDRLCDLTAGLTRAAGGWRHEPWRAVDRLIGEVEGLNGGDLGDDVAVLLLTEA